MDEIYGPGHETILVPKLKAHTEDIKGHLMIPKGLY